MKLRQFSNGKEKFWGFGGGLGDMQSILTSTPETDFDLLEVMAKNDMVDPCDPFLEISGDDPVFPFSFLSTPYMSPASIAVAKALGSIPRPGMVIDWEQIDNTPEALRFQFTEKQWVCSGYNTAYELGRFITRKNEVGLIKSLQTELTFIDNALRWPRGDSMWHTRTLGVDRGEVNVTWVIKVEGLPNNDIDPTAFRLFTGLSPTDWMNEIPGVIHPDMKPWQRMLFLWGSDHDVHIRCPQNSLVSLWMFRHEDLTPDDVFVYGGLMKGFTQITESDRTYENFTRSY